MKSIKTDEFGMLPDGRMVRRFELSNDNGVIIRIMDYGAAILNIIVPDRFSNSTDIALGYDKLEGYLKGSANHGMFVGRFANRIKGASFELNGRTYNLEKNDGNNHLHGTWGRKLYKSEIKESKDELRLIFEGVSTPDDEGFPGNVTYRVEYALNNNNELVIDYFAETDEDTVINPTNHTYFNLNGQNKDLIMSTELELFCDYFTEGDSETIPTGRILSVERTLMDFRRPRKIGRGFKPASPCSYGLYLGEMEPADYNQLTMCHGYDHNFIINGEAGTLRSAARARSTKSGIVLECDTTQPGIQFYTGNYLDTDAANEGKGGSKYPRYGGFCLETQHFPASPNYPKFPSTVLKSGELFHETTIYRFGIKK